MADFDDIFEMLSMLQETLSGVDNKLSGLDNKLDVLDSRITQLESRINISDSVPQSATLNLIEPRKRLGEAPTLVREDVKHIKLKVDNMEPILQGVATRTSKIDSQQTNIMTRLLKIEQTTNNTNAKLAEVDTNVNLIVQYQPNHSYQLNTLEKKLITHDQRFDNVDKAINDSGTTNAGRFNTVDSAIKQLSNDASTQAKLLGLVKSKVDDISTKELTNGRFDRLDNSISSFNTKSDNQINLIITKTDEIIAMERAHKFRDEVIYVNTIVRELNHTRPKHDQKNNWLLDIHTGEAIGITNMLDIEKTSDETFYKILKEQLGMPHPPASYARKWYLAYLKGDRY